MSTNHPARAETEFLGISFWVNPCMYRITDLGRAGIQFFPPLTSQPLGPCQNRMVTLKSKSLIRKIIAYFWICDSQYNLS